MATGYRTYGVVSRLLSTRTKAKEWGNDIGGEGPCGCICDVVVWSLDLDLEQMTDQCF